MVIVVAYTFELIIGLFFSLYTTSTDRSATALSPAACSSACGAHSSCGGFVWDAAQTPPCLLVVEPTETGATASSSTSAYRMTNYAGGNLRYVHHGADTSWQTAFTRCTTSTPAMQLLPYATNSRERSILTIRRGDFVYVDLQLSSSGTYVDQSGTAADMSQITWCLNNPNKGSEKCVGVGCTSNTYFDFACNRMGSSYVVDVFCLG